MNRLFDWLFSNKKSLPIYNSDLSTVTRSLPEANKWVLSEFVLSTLVPVVGVHPYPLDELLLMCSAVAYFKPDVIIEWGTHQGRSARVFHEVSVYLELQGTLHSIDLPPDHEHVENIHKSGERAIFVRGLPVSLHLGDGLTIARKVLAEAKPLLPLFFVDGDHSFESVHNELTVIKEISPRAVILAHDTFLQEPRSGYNCGPYEALKKFTDDNRLPLQSTILGLPGMSLTYWL
jgi:cephalosporin hydroxylase